MADTCVFIVLWNGTVCFIFTTFVSQVPDHSIVDPEEIFFPILPNFDSEHQSVFEPVSTYS